MKRDVYTSGYLPFPPYVSKSKHDALEELKRHCSRFKSPLTPEENLKLFVSRKLNSADMLSNATQVVSSGTPLNWQALLRYLRVHGVISKPQFRYIPRRNDLPAYHWVDVATKQSNDSTDGSSFQFSGFAGTTDIETGMSKAVGETLERFFLTRYKSKAFVGATPGELRSGKKPSIDLHMLNKFEQWQIDKNPRLARNDESEIQWVKGVHEGVGEALIPAQLIYWNYDFSHNPLEPILMQPTTNGAAGHFTRKEAVAAGLLEYIQRDGFLIYWLNGLAPNRIDIEGISDPSVRELMEKFERYGLQAHFLNTTSDVGIPSITCVLLDLRGEPMIALGGGTGFDIASTIAHSGHEALAVLNSIFPLSAYPISETYEPFTDNSLGRTERLRAWRGEAMLQNLQFFLGGRKQSVHEFLGDYPSLNTCEEQLACILENLKKLGHGYEVYTYDAQHEVLKTLGYHVVQTIVPQLVPMYLNENLAPLNSKRLREVPEKLGFKAAITFTRMPHPFP